MVEEGKAEERVLELEARTRNLHDGQLLALQRHLRLDVYYLLDVSIIIVGQVTVSLPICTRPCRCLERRSSV